MPPIVPAVLAALLLSLLPACRAAQYLPDSNEPRITLTASESTMYRAALEEMMNRDQRHRHALTWQTTDPEELDRLRSLGLEDSLAEQSRREAAGIQLDAETRRRLEQAQVELDISNTKRLMDLVSRYGWPNEERLGPGFADPTAVLIHMRPEDTASALPILKTETLAGRMPPKKYAMIYDRQQQHHGRPQLYGTVSAFDPETRSILPPAIVDPEQTNQARAEIGLEPLRDYRVTDSATAAGR